MMRWQNGQMAGWLKVVLIVLAVGVVGFIAVICLVFNTVKQSLNPETAAKVAHEIVDLKDPLPEGWKYVLGMPFPGGKMATLQDSKNQTIVEIVELPNPKHESAEQLLSDPHLQNSRQLSGGTSLEIQNKGSETVAGQRMFYLRGKATGKTKSVSAVETACVVLPSGRTIMVQTFEPNKDTFDPSLLQPMLDSITGFRQ